MTDTYDYFESRNYVNDINQQYTQVLTAYDENGKIRELTPTEMRDWITVTEPIRITMAIPEPVRSTI